MYSLIYEGDTVIYDYVMYFSIILSSIKLVFLFLCSLLFFPPWNMWVLGLWVWFGGGQVKLYFFLFFTKHKVVYVNYSLILTISFCSSIASGLYNSNELPSPACHETKHSTMSLENYHFNFYYEPKKITCNFIYYFPLMFIKLSF